MNGRHAATLAVGVLPAGRAKNRLLRRLGHPVHRRARIDPVLLLGVDRLVVGDRARLHPGTVVRGLRELRLEGTAVIGPRNWISSSPSLHTTSDAAGRFRLGRGATVSTGHRVDCSGGVTLGAEAAIAGWDSLLMTHDVGPDQRTLHTAPIEIDDGGFLHAANRVAPGVRLGAGVRTEIGTVLPAGEYRPGVRYAGNPAVAQGENPRRLPRPHRPHVVHVLPTVDDAFGGPGPVLAAWLEASRRRGGSATVFATVSHRGAVADRLAAVTEVDLAAPGRVLGRFYGNARQLRRLRAAVAGADLVVSHSFFHVPGLAAAWQARRHGVPWVVAPHGSLDPWDVAHHHPGVKSALAPVWRRVLTGNAVWCVTPKEAGELVTFGAHPRAEVIGCPTATVDPLDHDRALAVLRAHDAGFGDRVADALARGGRVVSFVGRFDQKKGLARLVRAFDEAAGDDDVLVLAGDGDAEWRARVDGFVAASDRRPQILRPGWIGPDTKLALWSLPGVFALVSDNENFGVAVAEAMACGRPVLLTDRVALAPLVVAAGAGCVTTLDHQDVVCALQRLLRDDEFAARAGRAATGLVRDHLSAAAVDGRYREAVARSLTTPSPAPLNSERIA